MKPVVNLIKLGRLPFVEAFNVQKILFDNLKNSLSAASPITSPPSHNQHDALGDGKRAKLKTSGENDDLIYNPSNNRISQCNTNIIATNISKIQQQLKVGNSLILVEHEPVYTIGIRTKDYDDNYLVKLKKHLNELNLSADFAKTNRGGLITFHGPGQLVAYPIIYLGDFSKTIKNKSVRAYVHTLEATIIDTLTRVGVPGAHTLHDYPGVWLAGGERKIAFIGIACKRFVTMHGISINCDCDLSWFDHIVSCGIEDKMITSVSQELQAVNGIKEQECEKNQVTDLVDIDSLQTTDQSPFAQKKDSIRFDFSIKKDKCTSPNRSVGVESVAEAFCHSFSDHFDCNIVDSDIK